MVSAVNIRAQIMMDSTQYYSRPFEADMQDHKGKFTTVQCSLSAHVRDMYLEQPSTLVESSGEGAPLRLVLPR